MACTKFKGNWFKIDGEIDEKHVVHGIVTFKLLFPPGMLAMVVNAWDLEGYKKTIPGFKI